MGEKMSWSKTNTISGSYDVSHNVFSLSSLLLFDILSVCRAPITPTTPAPASPTSPVSPGAPAAAAKHTCNHLHTIGGVMGHNNTCHRCNQKKWPLMRRGSNRKVERRSHAGEVTVLAVGRCVFDCVRLGKKPVVFIQSLLPSYHTRHSLTTCNSILWLHYHDQNHTM